MTKKVGYQMAKGYRRKSEIQDFVRHTGISIEHNYYVDRHLLYTRLDIIARTSCIVALGMKEWVTGRIEHGSKDY